MRVYEDGRIEGTIGGGSFEQKVIGDAIKQIKAGTPCLVEHHLLQQHEMCCGGSIKVFIEPELKNKRLFVFGSGHVGREVALLALKADFEIAIIDDRQEFVSQIQEPEIKIFLGGFLETAERIQFDRDSYVVILTYRHDIDRSLLRFFIKKNLGYLGMIGSQRKILVTRKMMTQEGVASEEELDSVNMPIGLNIGSETPYEIAVSILGKLIEIRNSNSRNVAKQINDIERCIKGMP